jgi:predicted small lipoprotein YifL
MIRKSGDRFSDKIMLKSKKSERDDGSSSRSSGEFVVISNYRPSSRGWAIIVLSVTALALGGCGRKAGLDLPPNASTASSAAPATADTETERAAQPGVFNSTYGSEAAPTASKGRKKPFVLDPLLGN